MILIFYKQSIDYKNIFKKYKTNKRDKYNKIN